MSERSVDEPYNALKTHDKKFKTQEKMLTILIKNMQKGAAIHESSSQPQLETIGEPVEEVSAREEDVDDSVIDVESERMNKL